MKRILFLLLVCLNLSACAETEFISHVAKNAFGDDDSHRRSAANAQQQGNFKVGKPYDVEGTTYYPKESYDLVETGIASWYGPGFHGGRTASGEKFDTNELTAAHRTLQMPSLVRVTNLENGRSVVVRVNDRGPFARGRVMDVSSKAADLLGFKGKGTAKVKIEVLPQESMRIAELAKRGVDTTRMEIAANEGRLNVPEAQPPGSFQTASLTAPAPPSGPGLTPIGSVTAEALAPIPMHQSADGRMMPDPIVTHEPVHPTSIFVQAGAFTVADNAQRMVQKLSAIGNASITQATINGKQFYRVRVGPIADVDTADRMLNRVVAAGNEKAILIVE